jgi:hypothetical protein
MKKPRKSKTAPTKKRAKRSKAKVRRKPIMRHSKEG